jgi:hypothetical protein
MFAPQYIALMKSFSSELSPSGRVIEYEELKEYILHGLDGDPTPLMPLLMLSLTLIFVTCVSS